MGFKEETLLVFSGDIGIPDLLGQPDSLISDSQTAKSGDDDTPDLDSGFGFEDFQGPEDRKNGSYRNFLKKALKGEIIMSSPSKPVSRTCSLGAQ